MNAPRFFTSHTGELVRHADCATIRPLFARHCVSITNGLELRASLRAGRYAWPGGYTVAYVTNDSGTLCPDCVRAEIHQCIYSLRHNTRDGWRIVGMISAAESDDACTCDHCGREVWAGVESDV